MNSDNPQDMKVEGCPPEGLGSLARAPGEPAPLEVFVRRIVRAEMSGSFHALKKIADHQQHEIRQRLDQIALLQAKVREIAKCLAELQECVEMNTGEGGVERSPQQHNAPGDAERSDRPSPASVPDWVPSADSLRQACGESRPGMHWEAIRRLIASRAPAAPCVDVERLLMDYYSIRRENVSSDDMRDMTRALHAQGIATKDGAP